ncbi:hypothetical protein [Flavobacterium muglaense]|uniref:Lipoprotein n=1 Tax=Flavobacterium muglaense TaxID=2764716 RepID=A0A923SG18_9FLAO|nr:hypothetical protein [Flavobacterium muglaense]MBC5837640.1 hypothetical protein [Flavobacterium muglaense]MBC5844244.1 hypothetical protein [Flavobacterium muglaense]
MMKYFLLFVSILAIGCKGKTDNAATKLPIDLVKENEQKSMEKTHDDLGTRIGSFEFQVKTDDVENFEDGMIPWADLEKPQQELVFLDKRDEIVIKDNQVKVVIDYPLTNQYDFVLQSAKGFTRGQLLIEISKHYYKLYAEEEQTATVKTIPINQRTTMYNRNQTNGKYGVWGHDIADLDLSEITVYKNKKGETVLLLGIES